MNVIETKAMNLVKFHDLEDGHLFQHSGCYYMVIPNCFEATHKRNAVLLSSAHEGELRFFNQEDIVQKIEADLVVR